MSESIPRPDAPSVTPPSPRVAPSLSPRESLHAIAWWPRTIPLAAMAVAARGPCARALVLRLLEHPEEDRALLRLRGVAGPGLVVFCGETDALPWVSGAIYLGQDPSAPSLLMPTTRAPSPDAALVERAFFHRVSVDDAPLAVLLDPPALVPLCLARVLSETALRHFLDEESRR